jgi:hypothetical protein
MRSHDAKGKSRKRAEPAPAWVEARIESGNAAALRRIRAT